MIIKTQDNAAAINFVNMDYVVSVEISIFDDGSLTHWAIQAKTMHNEKICLGMYKTIRRAREVVNDILNMLDKCACGKQVYRMPRG